MTPAMTRAPGFDMPLDTWLRDAIAGLKKVLDSTRNMQAAGNVVHLYADKFALAEFMTAGAAHAGVLALRELGVDMDHLDRIMHWVAAGKSIRLAFTPTRASKQVRTEPMRYDTTVAYTLTLGVFGGGEDVVVREFKATHKHRRACVNEAPAAIEVDLTWLGKRLQYYAPEGGPMAEDDCDFPLPGGVAGEGRQASTAADVTLAFSIDRERATCRTPTRNDDVAGARAFFVALHQWGKDISAFLRGAMFEVDDFLGGEPVATAIERVTPRNLFLPVLPVMDAARGGSGSATDSSPARRRVQHAVGATRRSTGPPMSRPSPSVLPLTYALEGSMTSDASASEVSVTESDVVRLHDLAVCMGQAQRVLQGQLDAATKAAPSGSSIYTAETARVALLSYYLSALGSRYTDAVNYLERVLAYQLSGALGAVVTPADFASCIAHHQRKLFVPAHRPLPFCHAVGRPGRDPEGHISITTARQGDQGRVVEIETFCRRMALETDMRFELSASAQGVLRPEVFLHGHVDTVFGSGPRQAATSALTLRARAQQFACYVLVLGRVESNDTFLPEQAVILRNKDELEIPLSCASIPTKAEFKKAVQSLSPEMQTFASAIRGMQLAATLFGILAIQVKPQLEAILNLPEGALVQETELGETIVELFDKYDIPSEMLAFDPERRPPAGGGGGASPAGGASASAAARSSTSRTSSSSLMDVTKEPTSGGPPQRVRRPKPRGRAKVATAPAGYSDPTIPVDLTTPSPVATPLLGDSEGTAVGTVAPSLDVAVAEVKQWVAAAKAMIAGKESEQLAAQQRAAAFANSRGSSHTTGQEVFDAVKCETVDDDLQFCYEMACEEDYAYADCALECAPADCAPAECAAEPPSPEASPAREVPSPTRRRDAGGGVTGARPVADGGGDATAADAGTSDISAIPQQLEARVEAVGGGALPLRPVVLTPEGPWVLRQQSLVGAATTHTVDVGDPQVDHRRRAYRLLDALTRSGAAPLTATTLHVLVSSVHCYDRQLMDAVLEDNVNPVAEVELSALTVASVTHGAPPEQLISDSAAERVRGALPQLFA